MTAPATQLALKKFDLSKTDDRRVFLIVGKRNTGKCLGRGTPVFVEDGSIKKIEDVAVGDRLIGDDGTPRIVTGLARGRDMMYHVKPTSTTGEGFYATGQHILCLKFGGSEEATLDDTAWMDDTVEMTIEDFIKLPVKTNVFQYRVCNEDVSRYAFEIVPVGIDEYYGVEVEGPNRRFLLGDCTVTHNSQLTSDLLFHKRHIPVGILMSSTEEATGFFQGVCGIPDAYIFSDWQPAVVDNIIAKQKKLAKAGKLRNCFIVLDDLAFDKQLFNSRQMRELMFNGRHYGILLIITAQFLGDLPTYFRSNVDYVITCRTPGIQDRERLWKNFFGAIPTFHMFQAIMDNTTEDYHALVLDNTVQSNALEDCIFWYKSPLRTPTSNNFLVGCKAYHSFAKRRAKKDDEDEAEVAQKALVPSSKKPKVIVKKINK